jgi:hypothetical protein
VIMNVPNSNHPHLPPLSFFFSLIQPQLEYRFRLLDAPAGDYSLQATDVATGLTGQSPLFLLSTQRRRRKLYGPIMNV